MTATAKPNEKAKPNGFENPYNFIPCAPRVDPSGQPLTGPLGDAPPPGHECDHPDRLGGQLKVQLKVCTPLLILDTRNVTVANHKIYDMRKDTQGRPLLPATALRGMLRNAYEAITNSRMGTPPRSDALNLLHRSLHPAKKLEELSPADRLFGWVHQQGGHKGQLRIGTVTCLTDPQVAIEPPTGSRGLEGIPLKPLQSPKKPKTFYMASDAQGSPWGEADARSAPYGAAEPRFIRGRKVYPHHQAFKVDDPGGWGGGHQKKSNFSIREWIATGTEFSFHIHFSNLHPVELGALLYVLQLAKGHCLRLGTGKPLGFGSVELTLLDGHLEKGQARAHQYSRLLDEAPPTQDVQALANDLGDTVQAYTAEMKRQYGSELSDRMLTAFRNAAAGSNHIFQYPRPGGFTRTLPALWKTDRSMTP